VGSEWGEEAHLKGLRQLGRSGELAKSLHRQTYSRTDILHIAFRISLTFTFTLGAYGKGRYINDDTCIHKGARNLKYLPITITLVCRAQLILDKIAFVY
jgi:hypothetical protein